MKMNEAKKKLRIAIEELQNRNYGEKIDFGLVLENLSEVEVFFEEKE